MLKRFLLELEALGATGKKLLIAVSGGQDSAVLMDLLIKARCAVAIAHANFQLRGEESTGDENWVKQLAAKWNVPFYFERFETNNYASEKGVSIQMAARDLRYQWFEELLRVEGYDFLVTAHHLNDDIETFLLHFTRGAGLSGLRGIPARNGNIIRPLLHFSKKEIEIYAKENRLAWREDASNSDDDYSRNFVRHQVVPKLKELNPSLDETFRRNAERLGAAEELMNMALEQLKKSYVTSQGTHVKISKALLPLFLHPAPVLLELVKSYGFNLDQCREMVTAAEGQPGRQFVSGSHQLIVDREQLIVFPHAGTWKEVQIEEGQDHAILGPWALDVKDSSNADIHSDHLQAVLSAEKLRFPLRWRRWEPGDFFFPLGMAHRKKVSDFLVDAKVSRADKDVLTVLESHGEIVWVVGYRIDNRFKILDDTQNAVVLTLHQNQTALG